MNNLEIIAIVVAIVVAGVFAYPYVKRKGWINNDNLNGADKAIEIARMIMLVININDVTKNRTRFILNMADAAVNYIVGLSNENNDKLSLSLQTIDHVLRQLNVTPTPDEQALIKRLVAEVLALYERQ